jgi:hypothetical protein
LRAVAGSRRWEGPDGDDRDDRTDAPPERAPEGAVGDERLEANGDDRSPRGADLPGDAGVHGGVRDAVKDTAW